MKAEMNIQYKQSEMLKLAQNKERELKARIKELETDNHYLTMALAQLMAQNGGRMVLRDTFSDASFRIEYNISDEPIIILR